MSTTSIISRFLLSTAVAASLATSVQAEQGRLGVKIPAPSDGKSDQGRLGVTIPAPSDGIAGCWTADRNLYGPYSLRFCINEQADGSYTVIGGGLRCNARLTGQQIWGGGYSFTMSRAHCGRGTDWTADTFTCHLMSGRSDGPRIAVPDTTGLARLTCTYIPAVWGYSWTQFSADRT